MSDAKDLHQETLLESLTGHLDALAGFLKLALFVGLIAYWAGMTNNEELEIAGLKIGRKYATLVIGTAFLGMNFAILLVFRKVLALLRLVAGDHLPEAITRLAAHPWMLNPYSYGGEVLSGRIGLCGGLGGLIMAWWFCNTALFMVTDASSEFPPQTNGVATLLVSLVFICLGALSLHAILDTDKLLKRRVADEQYDLFTNYVEGTARKHRTAIFIGMAIGIVFIIASTYVKVAKIFT